MKERRAAHLGPISGLGLLTGATALAAVAGGRHSIFATFLLGLLSLGMAHSLFVEIRRQARRRATWNRHDTINTVVLAAYGEAALLITIIADGPEPVRAVGPLLSVTYAAACALFVTERRRTVAATRPTPPTAAAPPTTATQATATQATATQATATQATASHATARRANASQATAGQATAGQATAGHATAGHATAGHATAGQATAGRAS